MPPSQIYYPRARVRFTLRFDDFGKAHPPPKKPTTLRSGKGASDDKSKLNVVQRDGKLVLVTPLENPSSVGNPQGQSSSSDGFTHAIDGLIPIRATLSRNGIRTADTLTLEMRFIDFPFDPRAVRAVAVEFFLGTIDQETFARAPKTELPETFIDASGRPRTNLRFQGWVDEIRTAFPDMSAATVSLECTDNTRLIIDQDAPPKLTIAPESPIDRGVADYLSNFPQFRGLSVEYRPAGETPPIPKEALTKTSYTPKLGPAAGGGASKQTVWDYVTDVVGSLGHTVRMDGTTIVVQRARTLYSAKFTGRPDDPFIGRTLEGGRRIENRLFVYGRNIQELEFVRKLSKFAPMNVEIRSYVGKLKRTLVVRFPVEPKDRNARPLPGEQSDQKWQVFRVSGVEDEKTLRIFAQGAYEALGRQELGVNFVTRNLASFGGGNPDPDALDLQAGDTVEVEFDRTNKKFNTIAGVEDAIATNARSYLEKLGYSAGLSGAYEKAMRDIGFPTTFRVKSATIDWDAVGKGVTIDLETINYLEVRADKELPAGEEVTTKSAVGSTPKPKAVTP